MGEPRTLYVYIDDTLMAPDPVTHLPDLANLTFSRKVGGVANVIFQSLTTSDFSDSNQFNWNQAFKIGASQTPAHGGAFVKATTLKQNISPNYMCDWSGTPGFPLQYMPPEKPADTGFLNKYPTSKGYFGTKGQPSQWHNSIWCGTNGDFKAIYAEDSVVTGMDYRGYLVENNYTVSWETDSYTPGIFISDWTNPWDFSMGPTDQVKYISWGYGTDHKLGIKWFDYGTTDPGQHDPSKAIPDVSKPIDAQPAPGPINGSQVGILLDWIDPALSSVGRQEYAKAVANYLTSSSFLQLNDVMISGALTAKASLSSSIPFDDFLPGNTSQDKVSALLRGLLGIINPRYVPSVQVLGYNFAPMTIGSDSTGEVGGKVKAYFQLAWVGLQVASAALGATASAGYLRDAYKKSLDDGATKGTDLTYSSATVGKDGTSATVDFAVTNLPADQVDNAMTAIRKITAAEAARQGSSTVPNLPSPDNVSVVKKLSVASLAASGSEDVQQYEAKSPEVQALTAPATQYTNGGFDMVGAKKVAKAQIAGIQQNGY